MSMSVKRDVKFCTCLIVFVEILTVSPIWRLSARAARWRWRRNEVLIVYGDTQDSSAQHRRHNVVSNQPHIGGVNVHGEDASWKNIWRSKCLTIEKNCRMRQNDCCRLHCDYRRSSIFYVNSMHKSPTMTSLMIQPYILINCIWRTYKCSYIYYVHNNNTFHCLFWHSF